VDAPSSRVDWDAGQVRLVTGPLPWPAGGGPRRAGVSSFGFSGTNAHVILEQPPAADLDPPAQTPPAGPESRPPALAWPVSGRTGPALAGQAARLAAYLDAHPDLDPADVAWSLATTRSVFEHRAVVTGQDASELTAALTALAAGQPAPGLVTGTAAGPGAGKVAFVFPGQGSQWAGMGQELYAAYPVYASALDEVQAGLAPYLDGSLAGVIGAADGQLDQTVWTQASVFAVQVAITRLLASWGVIPDVVAGHSIGEVTAAYVAGGGDLRCRAGSDRRGRRTGRRRGADQATPGLPRVPLPADGPHAARFRGGAGAGDRS
jgi:acyl transferase domain-containing protein